MVKKTKGIQIQVPQPCDEKWNQMTPLPSGNFCMSCEKTVVDFTLMTDSELIKFYQTHQGKFCGRFREDQLNRQIDFPTLASPLKKWKTIAALVSGLMFGNELNAQSQTTPLKIHQLDQAQKEAPKNNHVIEGQVMDEQGEPLIGANVTILSKGYYSAGAVTDIDGRFRLKKNDKLEALLLKVSYIGYADQEIKISVDQLIAKEFVAVTLIEGINLETVVVTALVRNVIKDSYYAGGGSFFASEDGHIVQPKEEPEPIIVPKPKMKITAFPNPFIDQIRVNLSIEKKDHYLFQLYTTTGQLVFADTKILEANNQTIFLNINKQLPSASYVFVISHNAKQLHAQQLVKLD